MECINATSLHRKSGQWGTQLLSLMERTAGPSASLGMTKGRAVTFSRSRQIGEQKETAVAPLRFAPVPRHAGAGGMTTLWDH
jgi:hypothetical protein